jgi:4-hydroxybenzoate decarboxylase
MCHGPDGQEVQITENINLFELMPHFRLNPGDGGLYISKASVVSRHPDHPDSFDEQNVGMYRFQVKGPNRLSAQFVPEHDIALG